MKWYKARKRGNRRPYRVLVLVCEGNKSERIYFNRYRVRNSGLRIETPNSTFTDALNLVKFAHSQIAKYALDLGNGDQIWCAFDADNNTAENIEKAVKLASSNINLCFSNPCFELWYLIHYCYFDQRITTTELLVKIERWLRDYDKSKDYFDKILEKRDSALKNAKKLQIKHQRNGTKLLSLGSNPYTQIHKLVEYILCVTRENRR